MNRQHFLQVVALVPAVRVFAAETPSITIFFAGSSSTYFLILALGGA